MKEAPSFEECLTMLRSKDGMTYEDGYQWLQGYLQSHFAELVALMQQETDFEMRGKFVELLGNSQRAEAIPLLARELESPSENVRMWAYSSLLYSQIPEAVKIAEAFEIEHAEEEFLGSDPTIMEHHPARHFLAIYQHRLGMAERGVTSPPPELVAQVRRLVADLSKVEPETAMRVELGDKRALFIAVETGGVIGELDLTAAD